jgi:hypothetical protein
MFQPWGHKLNSLWKQHPISPSNRHASNCRSKAWISNRNRCLEYWIRYQEGFPGTAYRVSPPQPTSYFPALEPGSLHVDSSDPSRFIIFSRVCLGAWRPVIGAAARIGIREALFEAREAGCFGVGWLWMLSHLASTGEVQLPRHHGVNGEAR